MAISDYKPIDDQTANPNGSYAQADLPFSAGLANRHANNIQFTLQNRMPRRAKTWDSCTTTLSGVNLSAEGADFVGYTGNFGGVAGVEVPYTKGLQFSTHPALPLCIPFQCSISPAARFIHVNVAAVIENAEGGMMAYALDGNNNEVLGLPPNIEGFNSDTAAPTPDFFTADARATTQFQRCGLTSVNGYNGLSYFRMTIPTNRHDVGAEVKSVRRNQDHKDTIFLAFQSGVDFPSVAPAIIDGTAFTDPTFFVAGRVVRTKENFQKYSGTQDPGALHEVIQFIPKDTDITEFWAHCLQTVPSNPTISAYDASQREELVIYPGVPATLIGEGSGASAGGSGSPTGTGIEVGDTFFRYPITKYTIHSVSIEEEY